jgi:hypothetical protein
MKADGGGAEDSPAELSRHRSNDNSGWGYKTLPPGVPDSDLVNDGLPGLKIETGGTHLPSEN